MFFVDFFVMFLVPIDLNAGVRLLLGRVIGYSILRHVRFHAHVFHDDMPPHLRRWERRCSTYPFGPDLHPVYEFNVEYSYLRPWSLSSFSTSCSRYCGTYVLPTSAGILPANSMIAMAFVAGCQQLLLHNPLLVASLVWLRFLVIMNCPRW